MVTTARAPRVNAPRKCPQAPSRAWMRAGHGIVRNAAMTRRWATEECGRAWPACALAQYSCRRGRFAFYQRMPRLRGHQCSRDGDGTAGEWLIEPGGTDVLRIEHWHARVGDVVVTGAILDRLIQLSHRLSFTRGSWRQATKTPKKEKNKERSRPPLPRSERATEHA